MYVVALVALTGSAENEAASMASELGVAAYDLRLKLSAPKPSLVLRTNDAAQAARMAGALQRRGHGAIAFDLKEVIGSSGMVQMDHFRFTVSGVEVEPTVLQTAEPLPYDDVAALLPAQHRSNTEQTREETQKEFSAGRALLSGGLVRNRAVSKTVTTQSEEREHVLYIFRRVGPPWMLRESARVSGALLGRGRLETFRNAVQQLRANCPRASYDERLMHVRPSEQFARSDMGQGLATSNEQGMDVLAHALASWLALAQGDPYRSG